ncbi:MAG: hypothetical protein ABJF10_22395 [Chthoniobacter sp.]|uniref:hypothetical protein n=1 Tax=Chthoniobacter sp. TaxID=2510640 RepID=UPI0032ACA7EA
MSPRLLTFPFVLLAALGITSPAADTHNVTVQGGVLKIDGHAISSVVKEKARNHMSISLKATTALLGPCDRTDKIKANKFEYQWLPLGLVLREYEGELFCAGFQFRLPTFAERPGETEAQRESRSYVCGMNKTMGQQSTYGGVIVVDGLEIKNGTHLADIEPTLLKQGYKIDRERNEATATHPGYELYLTWDEGNDTIRSFSLLTGP